ncbi:hypothetical protein ACFOEM_04565 [Paenalcaligenes hominis]|uniref:hypothetical protein n=1 Tax=Paenalcaligenes hominis TaxID=643674 RepID=UPI003615F90D
MLLASFSAEEQSSSLSFSVGSFLFSACAPPQAKPNPIATTATAFLILTSALVNTKIVPTKTARIKRATKRLGIVSL